MKIVLAEVPYTKDRDISVEKSCVPEGAELTMAVFDEHAENNDAFYAAIKDADIIIDGYVHFGKKEIDARVTAGHLLPVHRLQRGRPRLREGKGHRRLLHPRLLHAGDRRERHGPHAQPPARHPPV